LNAGIVSANFIIDRENMGMYTTIFLQQGTS